MLPPRYQRIPLIPNLEGVHETQHNSSQATRPRYYQSELWDGSRHCGTRNAFLNARGVVDGYAYGVTFVDQGWWPVGRVLSQAGERPSEHIVHL